MIFKVVKDSFQQKSDGVISCLLKCPLKNCEQTFKVAFKSYLKYHKAKKERTATNNRSPPKWYTASVQDHMLREHIANDNNDVSEDENQQPSQVMSDHENESGNQESGEHENERVSIVLLLDVLTYNQL